jgi:DNA-binding HxlR family transcriptional regulator
VRVGAFALSLLSSPLHVQVVKTLGPGPQPLTDLRRSTGSPPQTTLRCHLRTLEKLGIVERRQQHGFPGSVDCVLSKSGRDLLEVADVLEAWLANSPGNAVELGTPAAKSTIKALVGGWESGAVRALASKTLTLTELSRLLTGLSYPSLERRLGAMRLAELIAPMPSGPKGTPYRITPWMRQAVAPLLAAARWERQNIPDETPMILKIDIEAAFLLSLPAITFHPSLSGICRLSVENDNARNGASRRAAGATAEVEQGAVTKCWSRLDSATGAWAAGTAAQWLRTVIDADACLDLGGDTQLAEAMTDELHAAYRRVLNGEGLHRASAAASAEAAPGRA